MRKYAMPLVRTSHTKGHRYDVLLNKGICHMCVKETHNFRVFRADLIDPAATITLSTEHAGYNFHSMGVRYRFWGTGKPRVAIHLCDPCAWNFLLGLVDGSIRTA